MKTSIQNISLFSALLLVASALRYQVVPGSATPRPQASQSTSPTLTSNVDSEVSAIEKQVLDVAEAMPDEKFNFTPEGLNLAGSDYKGVRSFAGELKHVGASNYFLWSMLTGDKVPEIIKDGNGPVALKSKAKIIAFVKDSFALGHEAAGTLTPDNMMQTVGSRKWTRLHIAEFGVAHAYNHYGQMVEYLRMNGVVPPASRGKSD